MNRNHSGLSIVLVFLMAFLARCFLTTGVSGDYIWYLSKWYDFIENNRGWNALSQNFSNYSAPYLYLLVGAFYLPVPKLFAIKLISILLDFFLATGLYAILSEYFAKKRALFVTGIVLVMPTVLFNGAFWGQCDAGYVAFLLWAMRAFVRRNHFLVWLFFSFAFAFKLQSVFFLPFLFFLVLQGALSLKHVWVVPIVFVAAVVPQILAGRPVLSALSVYLDQAKSSPQLNWNAPNLFAFLPNAPFAEFYPLGLVVAGFTIAIFWIKLFSLKNLSVYSMKCVFEIATFFLILAPFLLPKMHERYFFAADLFSACLAFMEPKHWLTGVLVMSSSFLAYMPFLFGVKNFPLWIPALMMLLALVALWRKIYFQKGFLQAV